MSGRAEVLGPDSLVYRSDASWASQGNRSGRRYHWPNDADFALAACGRFVLDNLPTYGENRGQRVADVEPLLRCKRRACAQRYEKADRG